MSYISNKFVRNILQEPPKWGPIGQIVYLRTYSRWLNDQQRRERWDETVKRVVNYSVDLDPTMDKGEKIIEAERLFETIYKMRAFPSGRTMWVGGTEHSATNGQSMFNCAYADVTSVVTLHDIVILLMNGVGVGVGVRSDQVAQFKSQGKLNLSNIVVIKDYEYVGTPGTGGDQYTHNNAKHFTVHDSREGWAEFVRDFVYTYLFGEEEAIYINVDHVRPEGTPLKTFGGRASGPQALIDFVNGFIQAVGDNDGINDIALLDTVNLLGRMVVSGGVRRSALSMLGDATSKDFINAKTGDYYEKYPWRGQANNSVVFYEKPSVETIRSYFPAILEYGEPGFVNGQSALNVRSDWSGFNPCLTGDTLVPVYGKGLVRIKDMADHHVKIRDGNGDATESLVKKTSDSEPILKIMLSDGSSYKVTPYHEFPLSTGEKVKAKDLKNGDQLISADIVGMFGTAHDPNQAYLDAWLYADGTWYGDKRSSKLYLYEPKHIFKDRLEECGAKFSTIDRNGRLIAYFPGRAYNKTSIPDYVLQGDEATVLSYVKGIFDSDGYVSDKPGAFQAQVLSIRPEWLAQFQMLLRLLGINSTIDLYKAAGETDFGPSRGGIYKTKEIFRLSVTNAAMIVKYLMPESLKRGPYNIKRNIFVKSVEDTGLTEEVYCIGVPTTATFDLPTVHSGNCFEILLPDSGFCVSGDTPLITRDGLVKISDAVGVETDIWNGHRWSTVKPFFTGGDKDLYRVTFNDGSYLDVTDYHRFSTETKNKQYGRWHNSFVEKTTLQMIDDLEKGKIIRMQPFAIEWEDGIDIDETYAYTVGMYAADGSCDPDGGSRTIDLYGVKMALPVMGKKTAPVRRKGYSVDQCSIIGLPFTKQESLEYKKSIDMVFTWSKKAALAYLAGLIDGDGSTTPGGGIRVYVSGREKAAKLQLLVRKLGMRSSLNLMSQKGSETNYGARSEDVYYLQITECSSIPCHRVDTSRGHAPTAKGANQIVKSIVKLEGKHNTYCFTESEFGMGVFGNTLTYQCNLTTVNFKYFAENQDEMHLFEETVRAIVRHNLRITNTTITGVHPKWDLTQKRDRLLGVSFTGYGDAVDILGPEKPLQMLERMKQLVHDTAYEYADKMGIPRPLLSTTVKPEGSITLLYGASSGIHDAYAPYYIRRVRMGRTDALSVTLEQLGVPVEDDKFTPGLVVFSFPIKSAAARSAGSKSAIEQLERYKDIMQTYVDHNASNTIYISKNEVEEVSQWVYDNWDTYIAVSFLPKMDSKYEQAPMEEIDEETYSKLAAQMPDLSDLHARLAEVEYEMSAGDELEGCDTGSCPIR